MLAALVDSARSSYRDTRDSAGADEYRPQAVFPLPEGV